VSKADEKASEKSTAESWRGFADLELSRMALAEAERSGDPQRIADAHRNHLRVVRYFELSQRRF